MTAVLGAGTAQAYVAGGGSNLDGGGAAATYNTAVGYNAQANVTNAGPGSPNVPGGSAFGYGAQANAAGTTALGYTSVASAVNATAVGYNAKATAGNAVALGIGANASAIQSIAIGDLATVAAGSGSDAIVIGTMAGNNDTLGASAMAIGKVASAMGTNAVALGASAKAGTSAANSSPIAIGFQSEATEDGTVALGDTAHAYAANSVAIGLQSQSLDESSVAVGAKAKASGMQSQALGVSAESRGKWSLAAGTNAHAIGAASTALGPSAYANNTNDVALGAGSSTDSAVKTSSTTINGVTYNYAGIVPGSTVSVGSSGSERTITNVAAGRVDANSTDAINGSQLYAVASKPMSFAANSGTAIDRTLGQTLTISGGKTTTGTYSDANVNTVTNTTTNTIDVQIADSPKFGNITINDQSAGNIGKITGVADGAVTSSSKEAVNGSQLYAAKTHFYSVNDTTATDGNYNNDGATGKNALAAGVATSTTAENGVALGYKAAAGATNTKTGEVAKSMTAIGDSAKAASNNAIAIGTGAKAGGADTINGGFMDDAIAVGTGAAATGAESIALGKDSVANGPQNTAIGNGATANGNKSTAFGNGATTYNPEGLALGNSAKAKGSYAVAAGAGATTGDYEAIAIGHNANSGIDPKNPLTTPGTKYSVALGANSTVGLGADEGMALGHKANATVANSVALGANSQATAPVVPVSSATVGGVTYSGFAGTTPAGTVSVGSKGAERQIQNVAAGQITSSSTDAINGSQLYSVVNKPLTFTGNTGTVDKKLGETLSIQGKGTTAGTYVGDNLKTAVDANGVLQVQMTDKPVFTSVTTGNTVMNNNGLTITGGPSITVNGINAGDKKITNVANGNVTDTSTDAINGSQLYGAVNKPLTFTGNDNSAGDVQRKLGETLSIRGDASTAGTYSAANVKTITDPTTGTIVVQVADSPKFGNVTINDSNTGKITGVTAGDISDTSTDAVNGSQLKAVSDTANAGWTATDANGNKAQITPNGKVTFKGDSNVIVAQTGKDGAGEVDVQLKKDLNVDSVTTGNTVMNNNGLTITGGPSITVNGIDAGSKTITNVAPGVAGTDAVNVDQLKAQQTHYYSVNDNGVQGGNYNNNGATGINSMAAGVGASATADNSVALGANSSTAANLAQAAYVPVAGATIAGISPVGEVSVGSEGKERRVTNVAAGAADTDAVNVSQLKAVSDVANAGWTVTDANGKSAKISPNGWVAFKGDNNVTVDQTGYDGEGQMEVKLNKDLNLNSVTMGNTVVSNNGLTITGGPSVTIDGIDAGGKKITNVAKGENPNDAVNVSQLNSTVTGAKTRYYSINDNGAQGSNYENEGATGINAMAAGVGAGATAASATALGNNAKANNANDVALGAGSVTDVAHATSGTTIAGTDYSFAGANPTSVVSVGSQGNERQITNVAAGQLSATSTDAVNGSQLYATNQAVNTLDGRVTNVENTVNNIAGDITNISTGQAGMFRTSTDMKAPSPTPSGKNSAAGGAGAVASGDNSLAVGNGSQVTANNSVAIGNASVADRDNSVSVGSAGNERQITNVAAGVQATDAVNVSQLKAAQSGGVKYDTQADGATNYNAVTLNPGGSPTAIHNVQAGTATSDAVNVGQLNSAINNSQNWAKSYTDQRVNQMGKKSSAGTAAALAAANLPQAYQPNQSSAGVAVGNYQGQSAISIGVSTITESGRYIFKASATGSQQGGVGVGVGAGMVW
ncbi:YadA-like family protein [Dyella japonica]|uniref:Autotransporter adhesin n=1 Tax=Dyella japonica DSM 16301 TaxID=1440762 RepID=A0A0G9GWI1_9GAMM|nr:YadA-like family protein [Dyella japonica]KLD61925.1 hypothetical protein Y882_18470 [Dyella japonica DSM 16301]